MEEINDEILGALARGYCSKENENKVVDPTLIFAMADEVMKVLGEFLVIPKETVSEEELFNLLIEKADIQFGVYGNTARFAQAITNYLKQKAE